MRNACGMQKPFSAPAKLAGEQARRRAVIRLTPLIDMVFILLVFFMLASSFLDWRSLTLDTSAATSQPEPSEQEPFVVAIHGERLLLNGEAMALETLIQRARVRQPVDSRVSLQPIGDTGVQRVISVLDALSAARIAPLRLIEDPDWQPAPDKEKIDALP
jgi:biopolymer transport protein ExbD